MKRVLVTGASGFIGRQALSPLRRRGFEVHAVGRVPVSADVIWHAANLHDAAERRSLLAAVRPSHLLHLAWNTGHRAFWTAPENFDWVASSLGLVRRFHSGGGRRLVIAGSCAEYDWTDATLTKGEASETATPMIPHTLYGEAKAALRRLVAAYARQEGLSWAWGLVFMPFGPYEKEERLVPSLARAFLSGRPAPMTEGYQVRDFLPTSELGAAFAALLDSDVGGAVNLGSGHGMPLRQMATRLAELVGRPELLRLGALPMRADDPPRLVADVTRLHGEVGWTPSLDFPKALAETVTWWRQRMEEERP